LIWLLRCFRTSCSAALASSLAGFTGATRPPSLAERAPARLADTRRAVRLLRLRADALRRDSARHVQLANPSSLSALFLGFQPSGGRSDCYRCACTHYLVFKEPNPEP
jgi:hypothetical protein